MAEKLSIIPKRRHTAGPATVGNAPVAPGAPRPQRGKGLALPHERDQSVGAVGAETRPEMLQAKRDLDAGQVDTDMHATPGLDAERRAQLVATPKPRRGR